MDLEHNDHDNDETKDTDGAARVTDYTNPAYSDPEAELSCSGDDDVLIPKQVLEGVEDALEGRTSDGNDLDDALGF